MAKSVPTNPALWSRAKAAAKKKRGRQLACHKQPDCPFLPRRSPSPGALASRYMSFIGLHTLLLASRTQSR